MVTSDVFDAEEFVMQVQHTIINPTYLNVDRTLHRVLELCEVFEQRQAIVELNKMPLAHLLRDVFQYTKLSMLALSEQSSVPSDQIEYYLIDQKDIVLRQISGTAGSMAMNEIPVNASITGLEFDNFKRLVETLLAIWQELELKKRRKLR